jgi:hypothetical protein
MSGLILLDNWENQEPILRQKSVVQLPPTGPADPAILQCPRTASSGLKLIEAMRGGSYFCLPFSTGFES